MRSPWGSRSAPDQAPTTGRPGGTLRTVLLALYTLLAISAGARAFVQLGLHPSQAPVAYSLSGVSALVYLGGTLLLRREDDRSRRSAFLLCSLELLGVLVVGTLSVIDAHAFPKASVWSDYGSGYGGLPLFLPVLALYWLRRYPADAAAASSAPSSSHNTAM